MRDFKFKLNTDILTDEKFENELLKDDTIKRSMKIADELIEVFRKNRSDMEESFLILTSLADAIYMYSTFGPELEQ